MIGPHPKPRPFQRPNSKRLPERKPMTIAIGFLYQDGLLLCADTQFTGNIKLMGSKILPHKYEDGSKSAFVVAGHPRYARMCVQLIEYQISALPEEDRSLSKMHLEVVAGIKELYQEHIFKHPKRYDVEVQLLVGLWSAKDEAVAFYSTEDTAVPRMYGYDCLGSGEVLAHQYIRPRYKRVTSTTQKPRHTETEVRRLAIEAMRQVKKYDPYCGGDIECLTLTNDGQMSSVVKLGVKP
jgi:20S proteasome alpha/beta subunit